MHLTHTPFLPLLSLFSLTAAAGPCTTSGALSWPPAKDCVTTPKYPTLVQTCRACCMNDQPCFTACLKAGGLRRRETVIETTSELEVERRAGALTCEGNEGCYKYTDGSLLCLNLGTGMYHDDVGGNGDYFSGKYTDPNGKVQTGTAGASATTGTRVVSTRVVSTSTAAQTQTTRPSSSAPGLASSAGAASAAVSSGAAVAMAPTGVAALYLGANVGLVGLVAGLVV